jgi:HEAT repeat protein
MDFLGRPNIEKMVVENDRDGLYRCLNHRDILIRIQAAQALAVMEDGSGWRFLTDTVENSDDADEQEAAAAILGELGMRSISNAHRAVPALGSALKTAHGETADVIRDALEEIGSEEAFRALHEAGYTATPEETEGEVTDYEAHFIRPVLPDTGLSEFLTAEQHLNTSVELREAELSERALVECSLALWLQPDWAYAWYVRGVIYEDLERPFEAWLSYRHAVAIDASQKDAEEALAELEEDYDFSILDYEQLYQALSSSNWQECRDAAACAGELANQNPKLADELVRPLVDFLSDEEREVRCAAIHSLGLLKNNEAVIPLTERKESSWLLRFSIIEALSSIGSVNGLVSVLEGEMQRIMDRNPTFSSHKDPLVEVEYERLIEIGVLALERTGDIPGLLTLAEGNAWEEVSEEELGENELTDLNAGENEEENLEADEDLADYVDEVSQMVCMGLDRSARKVIQELDKSLLARLSTVPDLSLIDLSDENSGEAALVYDLSDLRAIAAEEISRRGGG